MDTGKVRDEGDYKTPAFCLQETGAEINRH
jgi:hypothetical protein